MGFETEFLFSYKLHSKQYFVPFKIEVMAGPESDAQFQFTGIKKYFNSYTLTGRMNVSINYIFKHLYLRIKEI